MRYPRFACFARYCFVFAPVIAILVCITSSAAFAASNPFKNSAPDPLASNDDGLRTPADFEAALASRPNANGEVFVSRCRFAPFSTSLNVYSSFAGTNQADAIVGDTTFPLAARGVSS